MYEMKHGESVCFKQNKKIQLQLNMLHKLKIHEDSLFCVNEVFLFIVEHLRIDICDVDISA